MKKSLKFVPEEFFVRLPLVYYGKELDFNFSPQIFNFEVNGLPENGHFKLHLKFSPEIETAKISLDRENFIERKFASGIAVLPVDINHKLLSFDICVPDWDKDEIPLEEVLLMDYTTPNTGTGFEKYTTYVRDTKLGNCNLLPNWPDNLARIMSEDFNLQELLKMRDEIIAWTASRQILIPEDPHYGAIYSEEDKYCFKDAIFAACCFMRKYLQTGKREWFERALAARDYCFKGQYRDTGNPGKDGCWASMGIIDDSRGKNFRRITAEWTCASGVDTALIASQSCQLFQMGMKFSDKHLAQLCEAVEWNMRNMVEPGWFSHHENMELLCINMNSLGAGMIYAVQRMLVESGHSGLDAGCLRDADAGVEHVLNCQEAIGVYPYRPFREALKRGGAYHLQNFPDNGIGLQAMMKMLRNPCCPLTFQAVKENMRRSALWYLFSSRLEDGRLILEISRNPEYLKGLAFGNFTWCRITMLDIISQLWDHIGNSEFWKQFCRCHLRTIRETLWNHEGSETAPIRRSAVPGTDLKLVSWIQQAEWAALVFDNLAMRYGIIKSTLDEQ